MRAERTAWLLAAVLVAGFAGRAAFTLTPRQTDMPFAGGLIDIARHIEDDYVREVSAETLRNAAIAGVMSRLDPFSTYVPPADREAFSGSLEGNFRGVGVYLIEREGGGVEVASPIEASPAFEAGVTAGDVITAVDGTDVSTAAIERVQELVRGPVGTTVTLTLRRNGRTLDLTMPRADVSVPMVKGYRRNADDTWDYTVLDEPMIGYVRLSQFTPGVADEIRQIVTDLEAHGLRGLILDMRFNPGGQLDEALELADEFVTDGVLLTQSGRRRLEQVHPADGSRITGVPMAVLVNEQSASAAEVVAGALQDHDRALVVGTRTFGKGSVQETMLVRGIPGGPGMLKLTTAKWYLPSGRSLQRTPDSPSWGVEPDITIAYTNDELRALSGQLATDAYLTNGRATASAAAAMEAAGEGRFVDRQLEAAVEALVGAAAVEASRGGTSGGEAGGGLNGERGAS
ncbi:MAG: S41 family peptidase [Phycisphaerae bacterium]